MTQLQRQEIEWDIIDLFPWDERDERLEQFIEEHTDAKSRTVRKVSVGTTTMRVYFREGVTPVNVAHTTEKLLERGFHLFLDGFCHKDGTHIQLVVDE